jgi:hypothetical protein
MNVREEEEKKRNNKVIIIIIISRVYLPSTLKREKKMILK